MLPLAPLLLGTTPDRNTTHFTYWCVGHCDEDAAPTPHGGTILMGGGTDVDDAYKQQIAWSGGGDYLVLRAHGDDAYNPYIFAFGGANSVATLLTKDRAAASDAFVVDRIDRAEALWFAGGDQWTYLTEWQGTPMQAAIQRAVARGVPVGGTSAGCDIQGEYIYSAAEGGVVSEDALRDPYDERITLQNHSFVAHRPHGLLGSVLTDTHFVTRDRMGRLVAFVARLWAQGLRATALGIDEQTAIAIDASGHGTMLRLAGGNGGRAYVVAPGHAAERCEAGEALRYDAVAVQKLDAAEGDTYDFAAMRGGRASERYNISASEGRLEPDDPYAPP